jgi:hypothetical protein
VRKRREGGGGGGDERARARESARESGRERENTWVDGNVTLCMMM